MIDQLQSLEVHFWNHETIWSR